MTTPSLSPRGEATPSVTPMLSSIVGSCDCCPCDRCTTRCRFCIARAELSALLARVKELTDFAVQVSSFEAAKERNAALLAEAQAARAALERYGKHDGEDVCEGYEGPWCASLDIRGGDYAPCDCGFDAALAATDRAR